MENRKRHSIPSVQRVREAFSYDPDTGHLVWRIRTSNRAAIGKEAGSPDGQGYRILMLDKCLLRTHRVAWAHFHGDWPKGFIDHINGNRSDNRINNLRDVSNAVNLQNSMKIQRNNTTGFRGVWIERKSGVFVAEMSMNRKKYTLGRFKTAEEAAAAYAKAKVESGALPNGLLVV